MNSRDVKYRGGSNQQSPVVFVTKQNGTLIMLFYNIRAHILDFL